MTLAAAALVVAAAGGPAAPPPAGLAAAHFFPRRAGLVRIYEGRTKAAGVPAAGASCEVLESGARLVRESCTVIVARKAKPLTRFTYELRDDGIHNVEASTEGNAASVQLDRLVLPNGLRQGVTWTSNGVARTVKSAGKPCTAAGRPFSDCLVLEAVREAEKSSRSKEVYAAGLGLVEDAQWELVDVKGL